MVAAGLLRAAVGLSAGVGRPAVRSSVSLRSGAPASGRENGPAQRPRFPETTPAPPATTTPPSQQGRPGRRGEVGCACGRRTIHRLISGTGASW